MNPRSLVLGALSAFTVSWLVRALWGVPTALGGSLAAIRSSVREAVGHRGGEFHNTESSLAVLPSSSPPRLRLSAVARMIAARRAGRPRGRIPLAAPLAFVDAAALAVTWFGHSTVLLEIDGRRILTDPVWSRRVSPSRLIGPARMHPVPVALSALPQMDAIVISHDHYDHLDHRTVVALSRSQLAPFVVPLGVGVHLRRWGVPADRIIELDWGTSTNIADLIITCTEAQHFSGRGLARNTTLWASWVIVGPTQRAYFGGDTGYSGAFARIGREFGPFDLTVLPVGAYSDKWPEMHITPTEAVQAHGELNVGSGTRSSLLLPVHWATFNLAFHSWVDPIHRLLSAAGAAGVAVAVPMPGQRVDVRHRVVLENWWDAAATGEAKEGIVYPVAGIR